MAFLIISGSGNFNIKTKHLHTYIHTLITYNSSWFLTYNLKPSIFHSHVSWYLLPIFHPYFIHPCSLHLSWIVCNDIQIQGQLPYFFSLWRCQSQLCTSPAFLFSFFLGTHFVHQFCIANNFIKIIMLESCSIWFWENSFKLGTEKFNLVFMNTFYVDKTLSSLIRIHKN